MRTATTLGREHGSKTFKLLAGPEVPLQEQQAAIKKLRQSGSSKFAEVHYFETPRIHKFESEKEKQDKANEKAKAKKEEQEKAQKQEQPPVAPATK